MYLNEHRENTNESMKAIQDTNVKFNKEIKLLKKTQTKINLEMKNSGYQAKTSKVNIKNRSRSMSGFEDKKWIAQSKKTLNV